MVLTEVSLRTKRNIFLICKQKNTMTSFCPINLGQHHNHSHQGIEWAGIFKTSDDVHTWSMQQVNKKYADPSMKIVVFPIDGPGKNNIERLKPDAEKLIKSDTCAIVKSGEGMTRISENGSCYELQVGKEKDSAFFMDTLGVRGVVVYTEHVPSEFERDQFYFQNSKGAEIKPIAEVFQ